jgi:hypothetical protein
MTYDCYMIRCNEYIKADGSVPSNTVKGRSAILVGTQLIYKCKHAYEVLYVQICTTQVVRGILGKSPFSFEPKMARVISGT